MSTPLLPSSDILSRKALRYYSVMCSSPQKLPIESIIEAEALLELAHKYDMPGLMALTREYLLPGLVPKVEVRQIHPALA